jgi:antitoxin MazE
MELSIVRIGNSRGLRLPKELLERLGFKDKVEAVVGEHSLTLFPARKPRDGWVEAALAAHAAEDDALLIPDVLEDEVIDGEPW